MKITAGATTFAPSTILDRYELIEPIGTGGMGQVFLAHDKSLKREVAIKVLSADLASRLPFAQQMLREARAVAQLHHPHVATVYDVVDDRGSLCIVMEYLRGETLASRLRRGPLQFDDAIRYGCQIARALSHAHAQGIVHCDLKPGNIFVTEDDGIKVVDFGLARVLGRAPEDPTDGIGASATLIANRAGTPGYMPPEQRLGLPLDHRADIYSFGVVLREMFLGFMPGSLGPDSVTSSRTSTDPRLSPVIARLTPILERTLAPDATARFQSAAEVETALQGLAGGASKSSRRAFALALGTLGLLVIGLLAVLRPGPPRPLGNLTPPVVAVSRFVTNPGDGAMSYLAAGLSEMIAGRSGRLQRGRRGAIRRGGDLARRCGRTGDRARRQCAPDG